MQSVMGSNLCGEMVEGWEVPFMVVVVVLLLSNNESNMFCTKASSGEGSNVSNRSSSRECLCVVEEASVGYL